MDKVNNFFDEKDTVNIKKASAKIEEKKRELMVLLEDCPEISKETEAVLHKITAYRMKVLKNYYIIKLNNLIDRRVKEEQEVYKNMSCIANILDTTKNYVGKTIEECKNEYITNMDLLIKLEKEKGYFVGEMVKILKNLGKIEVKYKKDYGKWRQYQKSGIEQIIIEKLETMKKEYLEYVNILVHDKKQKNVQK